MKTALLTLAALALAGCHTNTHITRTINRADGSTEIYENRSDGYNYNPNFTGHMDNNYQVHSSTHTNANANSQYNSFQRITLPPNGQYPVNQ
jgi:hypothetical protein